MRPLNEYIDHTNLKANATRADIIRLCGEAKKHHFYAVCVNSCHVELASGELKGTEIKVASVVGFPLGASLTKAKVCEAETAAGLGATEIDMVMDIGALKDKRYSRIVDDIRAVVHAVKKYNAIVKVILETCLLTDDEIVKACQLSKEAGATFVKTSTGFSTAGATINHVKLMAEAVAGNLKVKASGGIRDKATAKKMIEAGADRIGSSASVEICK
ncbi:MAG TPA: deoxyribose-phosphate aldolase [Anaerovoracaceae bacterium]|nr:deoxyribose-phosphate aldolase [Anaerovoracaceae bacterium]